MFYRLPRIKGKTLGSITKKYIMDIFQDYVIVKLAPKTVNSIVSAMTVPLKLRDELFTQAYLNPYYEGQQAYIYFL